MTSAREFGRVSADLETKGDALFHRRFVGAVILLVTTALWIRPMGSSLWMDEFITWWVVKDSLHDAIQRSWDYQGQSPFYYVFAWATRVLGGRSEFILRLPSLILCVAAAYLLFRLARRLFDAEVAWLSVLAFVAWETVTFAASNFRPYALALFLLVASMLLLMRWMEEGSLWLGIAYAIVTAAMVWAHYLFGLALIAPVAYIFARRRSKIETPPTRELLGVAIVFIAAVGPLVAQLHSLWSRRGSLMIPGDVSFTAFLAVIVPTVAIGGLVIGVIVAAAVGSVRIRPRRVKRESFVLIVAWLLAPPAVLLAISEFSSIRFPPGQYTLSAAPAGALLLGITLASIDPSSSRRVVAAVFAIVVVLALGGRLKAEEDWREAIQTVNAHIDSGTVVLMHPGLVESGRLDWVEDPSRRPYLLSPVSYYPVEGRVELLPYKVNAAVESYVGHLIDGLPADTHRLLLVSRLPSVPYRAWLEGRLQDEGWESRDLGSFGVVEVIEFTRPT